VVDLAAEEKLREASRHLERVVRKLYPQVSVCRDQVNQLVWEAYKSTDGTYGEEEALVWARGYRIPGSVKERDSVGLKLAGSMEIYVTEKQRQMSFEGRLSRQSIIAAGIPETDPDYSRLMDLVDGITIMTDDLALQTEWSSAATSAQVPPNAVGGRLTHDGSVRSRVDLDIVH
jgi:hypothetical protein